MSTYFNMNAHILKFHNLCYNNAVSSPYTEFSLIAAHMSPIMTLSTLLWVYMYMHAGGISQSLKLDSPF